jgi:putative ABC transport system permease protein
MVMGILGSFLLMMVALGLTGVLWQNVTQRRQEIGLRRATGADGASIHRQILLELGIVTTLGLILGVLTVIQIPILNVVPLTPGVMGMGLVLSLAIIYLLAMGCGLYPSLLATRVQPAEALHYE